MLRLSFVLIFCISAAKCAPKGKLIDVLDTDLSPAQSVHYAYGRQYGYNHLPYTYAPHVHGYAHKHGYQHKGYNHNYGEFKSKLIFT